MLAALDRTADLSGEAAKPLGEEDGLDATPDAEAEARAADEAAKAAAAAGKTGGEEDEPELDAAGKPVVAATPGKPIVEDKPAGKPAIDPAEVLELGNGMQMTRSVIMQTVSNAARITDEANTFREVFGMTATEAKAQWSPLLEKMRADEPFRTGLQAFIERWVEEHPGGAMSEVVGDPAKKPITAEDAVATAERVVTARETQRQLEYQVLQESIALKAKYPALQDETVWGMFANNAYQRCQRDPNWTLTKAAEDASATLRRIEKGFLPAEAVVDDTIAKPKPAHAASATIGGNGAAPRGTRSSGPSANEEVAFDDLDDSVKDWMKVRGQLGFTD